MRLTGRCPFPMWHCASVAGPFCMSCRVRMNMWVCLKIGYIPNYSHLIGIMIINHWVQGYTIFRHTQCKNSEVADTRSGVWTPQLNECPQDAFSCRIIELDTNNLTCLAESESKPLRVQGCLFFKTTTLPHAKSSGKRRHTSAWSSRQHTELRIAGTVLTVLLLRVSESDSDIFGQQYTFDSSLLCTIVRAQHPALPVLWLHFLLGTSRLWQPSP